MQNFGIEPLAPNDDREQWREISNLFSSCLDLSPDEQEAFLEDLQLTRPDLVSIVRGLLHDHRCKTRELMLGGSAVCGVPTLEIASQPTDAPGAKTLAGGNFRDFPKKLKRLFTLPASRYVFAFTNLLAFGFYIVACFLFWEYGTLSLDRGWEATPTNSGWIITEIRPSGPAAGKLQVGDPIVAVNDVGTDRVSLPFAMRAVRDDEHYRLRVTIGGVQRNITLQSKVRVDKHDAATIATNVCVSIFFTAAAILISFLKPDGRVARFGYAALMLTGLVSLRVAISVYEGFLHGPSLAAYTVLSIFGGIHLAVCYQFFWEFFSDLRGLRRNYHLVLPLYLWAFLISVSRPITLGVLNLPFVNAHSSFLAFRETSSLLYYIVVPVGICMVIALDYRKIKEPEACRRARWVVYGSFAGVLPFAAFRLVVLTSTLDGGWFSSDDRRFVYRFCAAAMAIIPLTTTYAILKHQIFDIQVAIRRGLQYVMFKRVLQALLVLPGVTLLTSLITQSQTTVADALWRNRLSLILILFLGLVLAFRSTLIRWLDRRFFREPYDGEKILRTLVDGVKRHSSLDELAQIVGTQIHTALHPSRFVVMLADECGDSLHGVYDSQPSEGKIFLATKSPLLLALRGHDEGEYLTHIRRVADTTDANRLITLGIQYVVPLVSAADDIIGLLLFGPKLSDEIYTAADRKLAAALAGQMSIANELKARSYFRQCPLCNRCFDADITKCSVDGEKLEEKLQITRTIENRYRLESFIGEGGMGAVYQAVDMLLKRPVAIKILKQKLSIRKDMLSGPERALRERAEREAIAALELHHPNIISTYHFAIRDDGFAYFVMEYIAGETFRSALSRGPHDPSCIATWFDQLLQGLHTAHVAGIVHRDLKPENLLVQDDQDGTSIKILDFGIAKLTANSESRELTTPGSLMGSLHYMSPEQLYGEPVDERTDLFSVGIMLVEALTGHLPFAGDSLSAKILSLAHTDVQLPSVTDSDQLLNQALRKCLARKPGDRYSSAAELRQVVIPLIRAYSGHAGPDQAAANA